MPTLEEAKDEVMTHLRPLKAGISDEAAREVISDKIGILHTANGIIATEPTPRDLRDYGRELEGKILALQEIITDFPRAYISLLFKDVRDLPEKIGTLNFDTNISFLKFQRILRTLADGAKRLGEMEIPYGSKRADARQVPCADLALILVTELSARRISAGASSPTTEIASILFAYLEGKDYPGGDRPQLIDAVRKRIAVQKTSQIDAQGDGVHDG